MVTDPGELTASVLSEGTSEVFVQLYFLHLNLSGQKLKRRKMRTWQRLES